MLRSQRDGLGSGLTGQELYSVRSACELEATAQPIPVHANLAHSSETTEEKKPQGILLQCQWKVQEDTSSDANVSMLGPAGHQQARVLSLLLWPQLGRMCS